MSAVAGAAALRRVDAPGRLFVHALVVVAVGAFVLRFAWVLAVAGHYRVGNDASFYLAGARRLADGAGYVNGLVYVNPKPASAQFPPGFTAYLGVVAWIFGRSRLVAQLAVCVAGTVTVVLTGLVGRRLGGTRIGIGAATLAAAYPMLVVADGTLMSETLFTALVTFSVLAAYRVLDRPTVARWCVLGVALGLAILTRGEGLLLLPLLVVPIAWRTRAASGRPGVRGALATVLVAFAVTTPWTIRNVTTFHHPVVLANDSGTLASGANCDLTYHGALLGYWSFYCDAGAGVRRSHNEAVYNQWLLHAGREYARRHVGRVPVVVAARLGRTFGVYRPLQQIDLGRQEGRPFGMALAGWLTYVALVPFAVMGAVRLVSRRVPIAPLVAVVAMVVITSVVTYGNTRFRTVMEPEVVLFAVIGAAEVASTVRARRTPAVNRSLGPRREAAGGARTS